MILHATGTKDGILKRQALRDSLYEALEKLGPRKKVLIIPPDFTRYHSFAGLITGLAWQYYRNCLSDILPALGTHSPMTSDQIKKMFGSVPETLFRVHDWRKDVVTLGEVPAEFIEQVSEGRVHYAWPAQVNRRLVEDDYDLILSVGQVVPHEVIGMANHNKNIFVGTGGPEGINKSHFLGAVYGMERIMGRADTPVRRVLNYAAQHFSNHLPIVYVLTVVGKDEQGDTALKGLFIGDDQECFERAADLSLQVNFEMFDRPLKKIVVYLDQAEYKSTWLGNKSIYRTRMAIADDGELIILAPGLREFGEDPTIDRLIRKYGYRTTPEVLRLTGENADLQNNLSAAAHLIHGSSENRFHITYCPGVLSREEIEGVNFGYADLRTMLRIYNPQKLKEGHNRLNSGEEIFYISNPALGLWACQARFN